MSKEIANILLPPDVQFGAGCFQNLPRKTRQFGMKRPLIVADAAMTRIGLTGKAEDLCKGAELIYSIYDQGTENPKVAEVSAGAEAYTSGDCDGLIALGGGSVMDLAKAIRVVTAYGGSALDYDLSKGGMKKIGPDQPPLIAIPTTSGTGSEATMAAVITDPGRHLKFVLLSPFMRVSSALLDPELTLSMPPPVTAATGLDALTHCIEAFVARGYNPLAYGMCRTNFQLVGASLKKAVESGSDIEARKDMLMASMLGGMALAQKHLGAVHALAHPLSGTFGIPHGTANSIMLPHVMRFNAPAVGERYLEAIRIMGLKADSVDEAADAITRFSEQLDLPIRLADVGVSEDALETMAEDALNDMSLLANPATCTREDLLDLYRKAM
ncbi:MAG: iron-containing alcohol dehydrogenase [Deltaproteobacteria bacterium]|nr:iron-containing alcohol dehydrogenase [Deltaproteobacteria bacterium]